jgi:hypothetical protein
MEERIITSEEDDDNIYIYSDPDEETEEVDMPADSTLSDEEISEASPILHMLKVLLNPVEGWKSVRRDKLTSDNVQRNCFYPLLAILSVSQFAELFYNTRIGLQEVLVTAIGIFVSFFFGYFCIMLLLKLLMPGEAKETSTSEFGKVFVLLSLSTLCLFFTAIELCPMLWALLIFLPLWTVYAICRGARFFRFPDNRQILCTGLLCMLIIGVPVFLDWILGELLPK